MEGAVDQREAFGGYGSFASKNSKAPPRTRSPGNGWSGKVEHSESVLKNMLGEEISERKSFEQGEAGQATSGSVNQRQRRLASHRRKIAQLRERLYTLGFTERALQDLKSLAADDSAPVLQRLAAWEISLWHANQGGEENARLCLRLLPVALRDENNPVRIRQTAIIEAECQELLGNVELARGAVSRALESEAHADLFFAHANLEASASARIEWVNKALQLHSSPYA